MKIKEGTLLIHKETYDHYPSIKLFISINNKWFQITVGEILNSYLSKCLTNKTIDKDYNLIDIPHK